MNKYAAKFENIMTRLDPWYEKDMPDWIWDSVIVQWINDLWRSQERLSHVWKAVYKTKEIPNIIDGYDEWLTAFERYELKKKDDRIVFIGLESISDIVDEIIKDFTHAYKTYKKHAIAPDDAPLGAIPFATRQDDFNNDDIVEPNTALESQLELDLYSHYEEEDPIVNKPITLDAIKQLDKSNEYGDMFSAPVGKRVYRGISIDMETMRKILGKNMPKKIQRDQVIKITNIIVKPKGFSSWSLNKAAARDFADATGIGMIFSTTIDKKNKSAFILNPKLGTMFGFAREEETVQIKPVHVETVTIFVAKRISDDDIERMMKS